MADYPSAIYSPRTKNNKEGVVYTPANDTTLYAEDIVKDDDEIVAIETELGTNPKGAYASVKANLEALWSAIGGAITSFLGLSDTPSSYTDQAGKVVAVNAGENALEFIEAGGGGDVGGLYGLNKETLSADKTLVPDTDKINQYLDPNGANRIVDLDYSSAEAGHKFVIRNIASDSSEYYIRVVIDEEDPLDEIYPGQTKSFIFDGSSWTALSNGTGKLSEEDNVGLGNFSVPYNKGVGIGNSADGHNYGAALGYGAKGDVYGVGVGARSDGGDYAVALGYYAKSNSKKYSVALGYNSKNERDSEIAHNINGADADQENNIIIVGFEGVTSNSTPLEIFCGGQSNSRLTIREKSVLMFTILVCATKNGIMANAGAWKIEGAIKRDSFGNTALLTAVTKTLIHRDDSDFDVTVTADNTNESLKIVVTGDSSSTVQWAARLDGVETHF
jgi:hypothetical protein